MRFGKPVVFPNDTNISGWWYTNPSEKYEFVSWDDYPIYEMEKQKMFETTNQINRIEACWNNVLNMVFFAKASAAPAC